MRNYLFNLRTWLVASVFLVISCHLTLVNATSQTTLKVDVYYESLCPDSRAFIVNQLAPKFDLFDKFIELSLIPYGKATHVRDKETGLWRFQCQHGKEECHGNKAQTCAIHAIKVGEDAEKAQVLTVGTIACAMAERNAAKVPNCAETHHAKSATIEAMTNCYNGILGDNLLVMNGEKTAALRPQLKFVPTIVINENYSEDIQQKALSDFPGLICQFLKESEKPAICEDVVSVVDE